MPVTNGLSRQILLGRDITHCLLSGWVTYKDHIFPAGGGTEPEPRFIVSQQPNYKIQSSLVLSRGLLNDILVLRAETTGYNTPSCHSCVLINLNEYLRYAERSGGDGLSYD